MKLKATAGVEEGQSRESAGEPHMRPSNHRAVLLGTVVLLSGAAIFIAYLVGRATQTGPTPSVVTRSPTAESKGVLLPGDRQDLALSALYGHTTRAGVAVADIATDTNGVKYALTRIGVEIDKTATVGQINTAFAGVSGGIIAMIPKGPIVVLEVPNPGSLSALEDIISTLKNSPGIVNATKEGFLGPH